MFLYVGGYSGGSRSGEPVDGVSVFAVDAAGRMEHLQTLGGLSTASFLAFHPTLPVLYALERHAQDTTPQGSVTALAIGPGGHISLAGRQPSGGEDSNHISVHPNGRFLFAASPGGARVSVLAVGPNGQPGPIVARVQHEGRGADPRRQARPYPHCAVSDCLGRRLFVCDLGIDRMLAYDFDVATGALTAAPQPYAQVSSGAGPRHLAVHPSDHFVYVINELDATVSAFAYDAETGRLSIQQTISVWPEGATNERKSGAEIAVHPSGRFLFTSRRYEDGLTVFSIDQQNGELRLLAHYSSQGETPRHFDFDPSGAWLFVANQHSGTITSFLVDGQTGALEPSGHSVRTPSPVCVVCRA